MGKAGKGREKVGEARKVRKRQGKVGNYWVGQGKAGIRLGTSVGKRKVMEKVGKGRKREFRSS
jgi:hypothetical protein